MERICSGMVMESFLNLNLLYDKNRQKVINNAVFELSGVHTEEEVFSLSMWRLADLEPPLGRDEMLYCRALCRLNRASTGLVDSKKAALEILNITEDRSDLPRNELIKEAKRAYWQQFNGLSKSIGDLFKNVREIVLKEKAFDFLCSSDY